MADAKNRWPIAIPAEVQPGDCPMGVRIPWGKPCPTCGATRNDVCGPYPAALETALAAMTAERDAERGRADRAVREWDEAVAAARRDALEEAARIADECDAACEAGEKMARARRDDPGTAEPFARGIEARHIGRQIRAAALAARTGGRANGE